MLYEKVSVMLYRNPTVGSELVCQWCIAGHSSKAAAHKGLGSGKTTKERKG